MGEGVTRIGVPNAGLARNERVQFGERNTHGSTDSDYVNVSVADQFVERGATDTENARRVRDPKQ